MQELDPTIKPGKQWTADRARRETRRGAINNLTTAAAALEMASKQFRRVYAGQGHLALGYATWDEYVDAEFGELRERLTRSDISKLNRELTSGEGALSVRATAAVTGASPATVTRDARAAVATGVSR